MLGLAVAVCFRPSAAQSPPPTPRIGAAELIQTLDGLNVLGSLLIVGAHPDDENNAVLAYFARGRHIRTAYLSFTRGEGGQNLIGPEQSEALGLIRTQELLAARRVDGGLQFFTRAFDFGYSKSPDETLEKWGRERMLSDFVRVIRRFRPDVIVTRFSPTGSGGHGQHTATGHLAPAAFAAAGDPAQFPDQIPEGFPAWRARRLLWNTYSFSRRQAQEEEQAAGRLSIDAGTYNPILGKSYNQIAGEARSEHHSQGTGGPQRVGAARQFFLYTAGEPVAGPRTADLFQDIDTTWGRVSGAERLGRLLSEARQQLRPDRPEGIVPLLLDAYGEMERLRDPWVDVKRPELLRAIELAAGLWLDAQAESWAAVPGSSLNVTLTALDRSHVPFTWERAELSGVARAAAPAGHELAYNVPQHARASVSIPAQAPDSQPYWMREVRTGDYYPVADPKLIGLPENPPPLEATFYLRSDPVGDARGLTLPFRVPVHYRWVERVGGEQVRPLEIIPPAAVSFAVPSVIFPEGRPRPVVVRVTASAGPAKGTVSLDLPGGWKATPASAPFDLTQRDQERSIPFEVTPETGSGPADPAGGYAVAKAELAGGPTVSSGLVTIRYPHIPYQSYFPPARARVESLDVRLTARNIGYVMGAGDDVPAALEQLGASVRLLTADDLAGGDLSRFDAIVTGIRALNVREDLVAARQRLLDYVSAGGTLVVQYNWPDSRNELLAPYPIKQTPSINQHRVSVEQAPVEILHRDSSVLHKPNEITGRDFDGWVQERGLAFPLQWDDHYTTVFSCHDPGEPPEAGGVLYTHYGKGVYIYTSFSWFRELPAGVPGAYRIFANLVSGGK